MQTLSTDFLSRRISEIRDRRRPPKAKAYQALLERVTRILRYEDTDVRPADDMVLGGGLVYLDPHRDTIIIPDLHARLDFVAALLAFRQSGGLSVLEELEGGFAQLVFVGDGMHAEGRAASRWREAQIEFLRNFRRRRHMDAEMRESLGVMEMVLELKAAFPRAVHYLKGNHDNIGIERGNGNYPFMKFAMEGPMVTGYIERFYGADFLESYARFERAMPLVAAGAHFMISHAEPARAYSRYEVLNYRRYGDVVEGLTWTADEQSQPGSVERMIREFLEPRFWNEGLYFGGHRPVRDLYNRRANGRYVQIHNPTKHIIARIRPYQQIELDQDIIEIPVTRGR